MQKTNLNIVVLKLSDKLHDHPPIAYYNQGECISSITSTLTNMEIFKCCAQATRLSMTDLECKDETRCMKDDMFLEAIPSSVESQIIYNSNGGDKIFSL